MAEKTLMVVIGNQQKLINMKKIGQTYRVLYSSEDEGDQSLNFEVRLESSISVLVIK